MWGGIFAGGAQILSGAIKFLNSSSRGILQNKRLDIFYRTDNVGGGTVLNLKNAAESSRFRIDLDPKHLLHLHFGLTSKTRKLHRGITPLIAILYSFFN